jgi:hypothetical protein
MNAIAVAGGVYVYLQMQCLEMSALQSKADC